MSRPILLVGLVVMFAACEQPLAPAPRPEQSIAPDFSRHHVTIDSVVKQDTTLSVDGQTIRDSCTHELIDLTGSIHVMSKIEFTADGATLHSRLHTKHVTGVGLSTGSTYRFVESMRSTETVVFVPASGSGEVSIHQKMISQDGLPNSFTDIVFTFTTPPLMQTYQIRDVTCGE